MSMTPKERQNPKILNAKRRQRIATGSGTSVRDVNGLKQHKQMAQMMKKMGRMGKADGKCRRWPECRALRAACHLLSINLNRLC